jgi:hypothetical protein
MLRRNVINLPLAVIVNKLPLSPLSFDLNLQTIKIKEANFHARKRSSSKWILLLPPSSHSSSIKKAHQLQLSPLHWNSNIHLTYIFVRRYWLKNVKFISFFFLSLPLLNFSSVHTHTHRTMESAGGKKKSYSFEKRRVKMREKMRKRRKSSVTCCCRKNLLCICLDVFPQHRHSLRSSSL